jgi:hypothetical protein
MRAIVSIRPADEDALLPPCLIADGSETPISLFLGRQRRNALLIEVSLVHWDSEQAHEGYTESVDAKCLSTRGMSRVDLEQITGSRRDILCAHHR